MVLLPSAMLVLLSVARAAGPRPAGCWFRRGLWRGCCRLRGLRSCRHWCW